jgi:putative flippase GtrA
MKIVNQKDIVSGVITGATTGIIAWRILVFLGTMLPMGIDPSILPLVIPILWVAGVQLGYFLGRFIRPFTQFGRFACIGFANAAVDFGVLYILIAATGLAEGGAYATFKAASFAVATLHSYLWNKYWTFEAATTAGGKSEILSFVSVALASLVVNVGAASLVVALRPETIAITSWAGVGAVVGSATALVFSFIGFRVFVFKKKV